MIRFIHTADWQLGKPFGRMPEGVRIVLQEARLDVIDAIAKLAADKGADDVLVAGDVFDTLSPASGSSDKPSPGCNARSVVGGSCRAITITPAPKGCGRDYLETPPPMSESWPKPCP
jgi:hypothetical protein